MIKIDIENLLPPIVKFLVVVLDHRRQHDVEMTIGLDLGKASQLKKQIPNLYKKLNETEQMAANSLMVNDPPVAWERYKEEYCFKRPKHEKLFELIDEEHFFFLPQDKWFKPNTRRDLLGDKQYPDWYLWLREIDR